MPSSKQSTVLPCWRGKDDPAPFVAGIPAEVPAVRSLKQLFGIMECCTRCDLALGRTQVVVGAGAAKARLMFVGEAPGEKEDLAGKPFVGSSGKLLDRLLEESEIDRADAFITNIVACRPPGNRTPKMKEVRAHAAWLEEQIRLVNPELIVTLGRTALTYFLPKAKVTQVRGKPQQIPREEGSLAIFPTLHPSAVLRDYRVLYPQVLKDFRKIARLLE